jgi:hypothetical protein
MTCGGRIFFFLLAMCSCLSFAETNYSKRIELPPLRISFEELQNILNKAASLMRTANALTSIKYEKMTMGKGELTIAMSGYRLDDNLAKIPKSLDSFEYTARVSEDIAPVTSVKLSFADYQRTLSIDGQSPDQVDAVFAALRDEISRLSTPFGGSTIRFMLGFPAMYCLVLALLGLALFGFVHSRYVVLLPISIIVMFLAALIFLPINDLFSGFSVVHGDASFIVRYEPQIALFSLAAGLIMIPLSLIPLFSGTISKTEGGKEAPNKANRTAGEKQIARKTKPKGRA